ncbi:MAG TPA: ubiquinone biosynthesis hydroxylase [Beijerinckiaceae bacterium]|nr:ubiquinone biosynthesis hydroxylase [Beijerinckiaceae bacterium]
MADRLDKSETIPAGWRVAIAGGGVAGLALALALKQALGSALEVAVYDPALARDPAGDRRAYAIAAGARRMLAALGVWGAIEGGAQPILDMVITDSRVSDPVRPVFLTFDGEVEPGEPFAHMVESGALAAALIEACRAAAVDLHPAAAVGYEAKDEAVWLRLTGGGSAHAHLLVAADGARSRLREEAGIGWVGWSYPQCGIVATIGHERDHEGRAVEHFLPSGPFAMLPLPPGGSLGHRSSIVWTEGEEKVPALVGLDPEDQCAEVERRFGLQLGRIALETPLQAFPLAFGLARRFVAERLALLGDAAHLIHPIAGQGLNLGLKDAAALAEAIVDAARLGLDPGAADVLERYERARRFDSFSMGVVTDGLNRLFSNDALPVRLARDLGLGLVDRVPALKRFFIREAAGLAESGPRLLRGEAL